MTQAHSSSLLKVESVAHNFDGLKVLRDVNFDVPNAGIVGLIGPNGSGKTTLFNIVSGFLPPRGGRVIFDGRDITEEDIQSRCRSGLVRTFQTPKVFDRMTVVENVMVGSHKNTHTGFLQNLLMTPAVGREARSIRQEATNICEKFGLKNVVGAMAGSLPAGMRRNLELARAYIGNPKCLLLDEPSSGLNSNEIENLSIWLKTLNSEGLAILLVSHDMGLVKICDIINVLYFGEIVASGPMEMIQRNRTVQEAYLGM